MPSPIDKAIKTEPREKHRVIPTDGRPDEGRKGAEYLDTLVEGVILWRRDFGVPEGPLDKAFRVDSYAYTNKARDPHNWRATYAPVRSIPSDVHLEEGPHDNATYRVTYRVFWRDPVGYGDWPDNKHALNNFIEVSIQAAWPANAATGAGTKSVSPSIAQFGREKGPMKGPTFSVVHNAA